MEDGFISEAPFGLSRDQLLTFIRIIEIFGTIFFITGSTLKDYLSTHAPEYVNSQSNQTTFYQVVLAFQKTVQQKHLFEENNPEVIIPKGPLIEILGVQPFHVSSMITRLGIHVTRGPLSFKQAMHNMNNFLKNLTHRSAVSNSKKIFTMHQFSKGHYRLPTAVVAPFLIEDFTSWSPDNTGMLPPEVNIEPVLGEEVEFILPTFPNLFSHRLDNGAHNTLTLRIVREAFLEYFYSEQGLPIGPGQAVYNRYTKMFDLTTTTLYNYLAIPYVHETQLDRLLMTLIKFKKDTVREMYQPLVEWNHHTYFILPDNSDRTCFLPNSTLDWPKVHPVMQILSLFTEIICNETGYKILDYLEEKTQIWVNRGKLCLFQVINLFKTYIEVYELYVPENPQILNLPSELAKLIKLSNNQGGYVSETDFLISLMAYYDFTQTSIVPIFENLSKYTGRTLTEIITLFNETDLQKVTQDLVEFVGVQLVNNHLTYYQEAPYQLISINWSGREGDLRMESPRWFIAPKMKIVYNPEFMCDLQKIINDVDYIRGPIEFCVLKEKMLKFHYQVSQGGLIAVIQPNHPLARHFGTHIYHCWQINSILLKQTNLYKNKKTIFRTKNSLYSKRLSKERYYNSLFVSGADPPIVTSPHVLFHHFFNPTSSPGNPQPFSRYLEDTEIIIAESEDEEVLGQLVEAQMTDVEQGQYEEINPLPLTILLATPVEPKLRSKARSGDPELNDTSDPLETLSITPCKTLGELEQVQRFNNSEGTLIRFTTCVVCKRSLKDNPNITHCRDCWRKRKFVALQIKRALKAHKKYYKTDSVQPFRYGTCTICFSKPGVMAYVHPPTSHIATCEGCHRSYGDKKCPICRTRSRAVVRVY